MLHGVQDRKGVWKFTLEIVGLEIKILKATQVEQPLRYCGVEIVVTDIKDQKGFKITDDEKERGRLDRPHWSKCNSNREVPPKEAPGRLRYVNSNEGWNLGTFEIVYAQVQLSQVSKVKQRRINLTTQFMRCSTGIEHIIWICIRVVKIEPENASGSVIAGYSSPTTTIFSNTR
ncbi:hypothetical protein GH714_009131 [Hevea brasiliensis]|uniref:Uncharacterized protein n=1 Tax=Hevea brasiliensis TaxID=3981 RepID=A0A6A6LWW0_HEVBR|nr:hypothetical protein GH714_009131 [Hevea brasiliensis]